MKPTLNHILAGAAVALAAGALVAGDPGPDLNVDLTALARAIEQEEDHVDALELAEWIRRREPGLRVIDVRAQAAYEQYHVPQAERIAISDIPALRVAPTETIVLYSDGGIHAAQAWFFLRARGYGNVRFLRGGVYEWLDQVINPQLAPDATREQQRRYARQKELSEYFGGEPSAFSQPTTSDIGEAVRRLKRKTC